MAIDFHLSLNAASRTGRDMVLLRLGSVCNDVAGSMRTGGNLEGKVMAGMRFALLALLALFARHIPADGLYDPVPGRILKGDITVRLEEFVRLPRLPDSRAGRGATKAHARIQYMVPVGDGSGRLAINDTRGVVYLVNGDGSGLTPYLDLRDREVSFDDSMFVNESGLAAVAFHPQFAQEGAPGFGKFYTAYSAVSGSGKADYLPEDAGSHESVIREWTAENPAAMTFSGSHREVFRIGQFAPNHNIGNMAFNPSEPGLLYVCLGDGGTAFDPRNYGQGLAEPHGAIMRIDPLASGAARYSIPDDNPFVGKEGAAPEIWATGLRHPQHFSWDESGRLFISDIGQDQIEEVNLGKAGANYGWRLREGTFKTALAAGADRPGPVYLHGNLDDGFEYPVAQYDHDDGLAIGGGYVYEGKMIPTLAGRFVFADIVAGRIFHIDARALVPGKPAEIRELNLVVNGKAQSLVDVAGYPNPYESERRVDSRLGIDEAGELYVLTKGDGWIRKLVPAS